MRSERRTENPEGDGSIPSDPTHGKLPYSLIAQLVERLPVKQMAAGSSPAGGAAASIVQW